MELSNDTMLRPSGCHTHAELAGQKDLGMTSFFVGEKLVMPKIKFSMLK